jgi:hypothetical protein
MTVLGTVMLFVGAIMGFTAYLGRTRITAIRADGLYAGSSVLILLGVVLVAVD